MSIEELRKVLAPPDSGQTPDWDDIQSKLTFQLPQDYKDFIGMYGTTGIGDFLWVLSPVTRNQHLNLLQKAAVMLSAYQELRKAHPSIYRFEAFPQQDGLYPWGITDNGDELYWLMEGEPDSWPTVLYAVATGQMESYPFSMTGFIARWLHGELSAVLPVVPATFIRYDA